MAASDGYLTRFPLPLNKVITSFAGARAHEDHHEFIVQELEDAPNFFDAAGIESPGLTSSPAIGERLAKIISEKMHQLPNLFQPIENCNRITNQTQSIQSTPLPNDKKVPRKPKNRLIAK